jgi:hypothetical protein
MAVAAAALVETGLLAVQQATRQQEVVVVQAPRLHGLMVLHGLLVVAAVAAAPILFRLLDNQAVVAVVAVLQTKQPLMVPLLVAVAVVADIL